MKRHIRSHIIFCCLLGWISGFLTSAHAEDLYSATVEVKSQTLSARNKAARQALEVVLLRFARSKEVLLSPGVRKQLAKAPSYMQRFNYTLLPPEPPSGGQALEEDPAAEPQQAIVVNFSPESVFSIFERAKMPYWPENRPTVLAWIVEDQPEHGKTFINDPQSELVQSIQAASDDRGLRVQLPILDLDDQLALSPDQAWQIDESALVDASSRYATDTFVLGRYTRTATGDWLSTWQYFHKGQTGFVDLRTPDIDALADAAINPLADYLAQRYAVLPTDSLSPSIFLTLAGIDSFAHYRDALDALEKIAVVGDQRVVTLRDTEMTVGLSVKGDTTQLENALSLDRNWVPLSQADPSWTQFDRGSETNPLRYRWEAR